MPGAFEVILAFVLFGLLVFFGEGNAKQLKKADVQRVKGWHKQQYQERCQHQAKGQAGSHWNQQLGLE